MVGKTQICSNCKIRKSMLEFHKNKLCKTGYRKICKECVSIKQKEYYNNNKENKKWIESRKRYVKNNPEKIASINRFKRIKKAYGITKDQHNKMIRDQNGLCLVCGKLLNHGSQIDIDHCHKTGKIRGILHNVCNRFISCLEENPSLLDKSEIAIKYIQGE